MKINLIRTLGVTLLLASPAAITSHAANPFEKYSRAALHSGDVYGYCHSMNGNTRFAGSTVKDNGYVFGVGFGANTDYVNVFTEIGGGVLDTSYSASVIKDDTSCFEWKLGMDYNILKRRLTPLVTGTLGLMRQSVGRTGFQEWTLTYGVGGGLRWDITDRWFAKALYRAEWTSFDGSSSATLYHGFAANIGFKF